MKVAETGALILSWISGLALGLLFFGGLRWTVHRGLHSTQPALWFLCSFIIRVSIVLAGFYGISNLHFQGLLPCLAGFIMAQLAVIFLKGPKAPSQKFQAEEASHAPFS